MIDLDMILAPSTLGDVGVEISATQVSKTLSRLSIPIAVIPKITFQIISPTLGLSVT